MIKIWYTDPAKGNFAGNQGKFSSYYQYDTVTKEFVRVRLELGRAPSSSGGDSGKTFVNYKETRTVGFSDQVYSTSDLSRWSVDAQNRLCFDNHPLSENPSKNARTYDCSDVESFVHRGNQVTENPNFPEGIATKHLSLLANNAIINKTSANLTTSSATAQELSLSLKNQVAEVVGKPFAEIRDEDILSTLKQQVTVLKNQAVKSHENTIEDAIEEVDALVNDIKEKIELGEFTPNAEVESAFQQFSSDISKSKLAIVNGERVELTNSFDALKLSQTALNEAINKLEIEQKELFSDALETSSTAIDQAYDASVSWNEIQTEYEALEDVNSVEEYEETMKEVE